MLALAYNLLLLPVDLLVLRGIRRRPTLASVLRGALVVSTVMVGLALVGMFTESDTRYYGSYFTFLGLLSWGLFLHGVPLVFLSARHLRGLRRWGLFGIGLLGVVVAWEGFVRGPGALGVTRHRIASTRIDAPLRIVVLADLQTDSPGDFEREALELAMAERPDLVLLPGDYVQTSRDRYAETLSALRGLFDDVGLDAPLAVYAVEGNVDRDEWPELFAGRSGTRFRHSATVEVGEAGEIGGVRITGLSFSDSFNAHLVVPRSGLERGPADRAEASQVVASDAFHVVFGHGPDFALGAVEADLLVAGHTHGGQVRVPGFGPPMTLSKVPRAWAAGLTQLPSGAALLVSRGIGMERGGAPRVRFLCPPEVVVIDVVPADRPD